MFLIDKIIIKKRGEFNIILSTINQYNYEQPKGMF